MKRMAIVALVITGLIGGIIGCGTAEDMHTPTPRSTIPPYFTTYTDELELFSISYPPNWELALSEIEFIEQWTQEILDSIESGISLDEVRTIFIAVEFTDMDFNPNVNIQVAPMQNGAWTLDAIVRANIEYLKDFLDECHELSRTRITIGSREAVVVDYEGTYPSLGAFHHLFLSTLVGKSLWTVTCTTSLEQFNDYEDDLYAIVRSLRILE